VKLFNSELTADKKDEFAPKQLLKPCNELEELKEGRKESVKFGASRYDKIIEDL